MAPTTYGDEHWTEDVVEEVPCNDLGDFYNIHPELQGYYAEKQPEIRWTPDYKLYQERQEKRTRDGNLSTELPKGWPRRIDGPEVWEGVGADSDKDEGNDERWVVQFDKDHLREIEHALKAFKKAFRSASPAHVNRDSFPLGEKTRIFLRGCSERLHKGNGLLILRGLKPDWYSYADNAIIYAGVTSHIGNKRGVQVKGTTEVLGHIVDTGVSLAPAPLASHTNDAQPFHTDLGDVLCLYVLSTPHDGGESYVASAAKVYNEIAATRPDLIQTMADSSWVFDTAGSTPSHYVRPILFYEGGHVSFNFARRLFTGYGANAQRSAHLPPISEAQAEALDAIEFTALKYTTVVTLQKGDIQVQNNLATIHGRRGFKDPDGYPFIGRHLLRLWVRDDELAWPLPAELKGDWTRIFNPQVGPHNEHWPDDPTFESATESSASCA